MAGVISQVCKSCFSKVEETVILDPQALRRHSEIKAVGVRPQQIREKKELFFSNKIVIRKLKQLAVHSQTAQIAQITPDYQFFLICHI